MSVSIVFARGIVAELNHRGFDGQQVLKLAEIDPARLSDIHDTLQPDEQERLSRHALQITGDPALGLAVGAADTDNTFQLYGHLLRAQPTVREAFAMHMRFSSLIARGPVWKLYEQDDLAYYTLTPALRAGPFRRFMMEYAITASMRLCRSFFPRRAPNTTSLHSVYFQHEQPSYAEKYKPYFRCPVLFEQSTNGLIFPRTLLDRPQVHADPTVARMLRESAERLMQGQAREKLLHQRVRLLLRYSLDLQEVNAERVARCFGLTLRTLRRRLANEGHSLSELVDEARCRVACDALMRDDVTLPEVAELVGFSEVSAFFRAFKRWTGRTPGEYRRESTSAPSVPSGEAARGDLVG